MTLHWPINTDRFTGQAASSLVSHSSALCIWSGTCRFALSEVHHLSSSQTHWNNFNRNISKKFAPSIAPPVLPNAALLLHSSAMQPAQLFCQRTKDLTRTDSFTLTVLYILLTVLRLLLLVLYYYCFIYSSFIPYYSLFYIHYHLFHIITVLYYCICLELKLTPHLNFMYVLGRYFSNPLRCNNGFLWYF